MKLPRISDPKTVVITEKNIFGEISRTEITTASQFDLLPTWVQWSFVLALVIPSVILIITEVVK